MTDSSQTQRFAEVYARLQTRFQERSQLQRDRLTTLRGVVRNGITDSELREIEHIAHTLHGSAGTFGFSDLGRTSATLERLVRVQIRALSTGEQVSFDRAAEIDEAMAALCDALEAV